MTFELNNNNNKNNSSSNFIIMMIITANDQIFVKTDKLELSAYAYFIVGGCRWMCVCVWYTEWGSKNHEKSTLLDNYEVLRVNASVACDFSMIISTISSMCCNYRLPTEYCCLWWRYEEFKKSPPPPPPHSLN